MSAHKILEGEFVSLRPLQVSDAELTYGWRNAARAKFLNQGAASVVQQATWIASRPPSEYNFVIELKNGLAVGMVSLTGIDTINQRGEPGRFLIGNEDAVKGVPVAIEAMKLIYEFAFDQLGLMRICGTVAADNHLMTKWQKYFGMKELNEIKYIERLPVVKTEKTPLFVLIHGYGSNEEDLFSFAQDLPQNAHIVSVRAR